tara:strand:- start:2793 stop:3401 length:609 start_codon:yes stop_codon:yes gene_type:complete
VIAMQSKEELRKEARRHRALVKKDSEGRLCKRITANVLEHIALDEEDVVAGYFPMHDEVDCMLLLKALDAYQIPVALPVVARKDSPMIFRSWDFVSPMHKDAYGIPVPHEKAPRMQPTILLVPLLAFDEAGHRLGYGGGYYDRTLAALEEKGHPFTTVGLAFAAQQTDAPLPRQKHDYVLDYVVTEEQVFDFRKAPAQAGKK